MANVNESFGRVGDESRENDAFDHEMRSAQQQLTIFECARLAFVAIHDDERARVVA